MSLTKRQREVLSEHIDQPMGVSMSTAPLRRATVKRLIKRGLLYGDRADRPRRTMLTASGREMICRALGEIADGIMRKQFMKRNGRWTQQGQDENGWWKRKSKPLRDRAAYMRDYKRRRRAAEPDFQERING